MAAARGRPVSLKTHLRTVGTHLNTVDRLRPLRGIPQRRQLAGIGTPHMTQGGDVEIPDLAALDDDLRDARAAQHRRGRPDLDRNGHQGPQHAVIGLGLRIHDFDGYRPGPHIAVRGGQTEVGGIDRLSGEVRHGGSLRMSPDDPHHLGAGRLDIVGHRDGPGGVAGDLNAATTGQLRRPGTGRNVDHGRTHRTLGITHLEGDGLRLIQHRHGQLAPDQRRARHDAQHFGGQCRRRTVRIPGAIQQVRCGQVTGDLRNLVGDDGRIVEAFFGKDLHRGARTGTAVTHQRIVDHSGLVEGTRGGGGDRTGRAIQRHPFGKRLVRFSQVRDRHRVIGRHQIIGQHMRFDLGTGCCGDDVVDRCRRLGLPRFGDRDSDAA